MRRMAQRRRRGAGEAGAAASEVVRLRRETRSLTRRLVQSEARLRTLARSARIQRRGQEKIASVLRADERESRRDRAVLRELQGSVVRLEEYLLKTAERIENILSALKEHREFMVKVNKRLLDLGTKDRIRLELDVMKNTLSILSLNGIEFDGSLVKDIDALRATIREATDLEQLERAKADLDKKFSGELKKFDLDAIWTRKKEIPGYR